jgi:adenylate cyclase
VKTVSIRARRMLQRIFGNRWLGILFIVILSTVATLIVERTTTLIAIAENRLADMRVVIFTPWRPQSEHIAVILIDEETLATLPYRSPLNRALIADMLDLLNRHEVYAIGLNVLFDRPTEVENDARLYTALRSFDVPLVLAEVSALVNSQDSRNAYARQFTEGLATGYSFVYQDSIDRVVRSTRLMIREGETTHFGFASRLAKEVGLVLPKVEEMLIDFRPAPPLGGEPFPIYLAHELGDLPIGALHNRIVLIGADLEGSTRVQTPMSVTGYDSPSGMPGVIVQAHILSQLVEGRMIMRSDGNLGLLIVVIAGLLACLIALLKYSLWFRFLLSLILVAASWFGALVIFVHIQLLLPMVSPIIAYVFAIVFCAIWQWRVEVRQRLRLSSTFGQFLAPAVVEQILSSPDQLEVSGEQRELSFLFSDIEGFTALIESNEPQVTVAIVNRYLEEACELVMHHGGTIDKIVGDALHVFFNAPLLQDNHAQLAVECAIELDRWAMNFRKQQRMAGVEFGRTRIGVNTGKCIIGNFGGRKRFDYTAHGDAINTAARLESINKRLGTTICIADSTVEQCRDIRFQSVATLVLYGKTEGVHAYTLFDPNVLSTDPAYATDYEIAFELLDQGNPAAIKAYASLAERSPDDPIVVLHRERMARGEIDTRIVMRSK